MHLYIGSKLNSFWSLHRWLIMRAIDHQLEETVILLNVENIAQEIAQMSGADMVPVLVDDRQTIWDSLAIAEYLQEKFPDKPIWPANLQTCSHARCLGVEMHPSFTALRGACRMNLGKWYPRKDRGADVATKAARIEHFWLKARQNFGHSTDVLFLDGEFCAVCVIFAPVVTRLDTYDIPVSDQVRIYLDTVLNHPAFVEWRTEAMKATLILEHDEVDKWRLKIYVLTWPKHHQLPALEVQTHVTSTTTIALS